MRSACVLCEKTFVSMCMCVSVQSMCMFPCVTCQKGWLVGQKGAEGKGKKEEENESGSRKRFRGFRFR